MGESSESSAAAAALCRWSRWNEVCKSSAIGIVGPCLARAGAVLSRFFVVNGGWPRRGGVAAG